MASRDGLYHVLVVALASHAAAYNNGYTPRTLVEKPRRCDLVHFVERMQNGADAADGLEQLVYGIPSGHGVPLQRFWEGPLQ
jgi:hypothetical protein